MQINNNPLYQFFNKLTSDKSDNNQKITQLGGSNLQSIAHYDTHNMSPDDLKNMATELYEAGKISEEERLNFSIQSHFIEKFGPASSNEKLDMIDFFEGQIEVMKSTPDSSKGVDFFTRSLEILKGLNAYSTANIPNSV